MDNNIITIEDVRKLLEFKPEEALVTSFYLNVDPRHVPASKFTTLTRNLLREKQQSLELSLIHNLTLPTNREV